MQSWLGRGKSLQKGITCCCLVAFVLYGYDQGVFSGILQNENWLDQFDHPSDSKTGIIVSCFNLGCFTGCVISFMSGDFLGRRKAIWLGMTLVIIGAALQASAFTVDHLVIGRVITGFGTGVKTATVPMYQSELCDRSQRGRLVSAEVMFVGIGICIAYWLDFGMSFTPGSVAWRFPIAFQITFAIGVIFLVFALPESPRWLFARGREEEAMGVLCAVYDKDPTDEYIVAERNAIIEAIGMEAQVAESRSFFSIFKRDEVSTGYRVLLAWGIQFMNQVSGINLVVYYVPTVLVQNVGMTPRMAQILGGCINIMFPLGSLGPSLALDRMGRRKTMLWGCAGLSFCMMMVAALLSQAGDPESTRGKSFGAAGTAFFFLYMFVFGASVNCVPWVYVPEILPLAARTRGTAVGVSSNWIWNFTVVMITPVIINRLQWKAYLIFMATNLVFIPVIYFFYPETSNVRLEDMDHFFASGKNPVVMARKFAAEMKAGRYDTEAIGVSSGSEGEKAVGETRHVS
ncbi:probable transporter (major facilitator superfamily) [Cephalotrichum gorgonifer]|uniref:Probable transporter (Major facilitator superfamily) n=1 Tax=Cephalotrichum gorgonifer TaxID=2041049 RepID=A0AAE8N571_9PEZI|nr:probable transporter (major facilitator superfamily) [Cephalotrichum gorgonifer]